jgi:L-gulonolactone oxidase
MSIALAARSPAQRQVFSSWGGARCVPKEAIRPAFVDQAIAAIRRPTALSNLCYGLGRSYGDVCLNDGGRLILTDALDRFICADWERGIVCAEAGLSFDALLRTSVPRGWFAPVVPGTKFATLGGAVANDVHGKNHELAGTLGCHVRRIVLARSSGEVLALSSEQNADLFAATIGGLGLTGVILSVELQLIPIRSALIETETSAIDDLEHFFRLGEADQDWPYTVAWIDCLATGAATGRGLVTRGRHAETGPLTPHKRARLALPFDAPAGLLNAHTIGAFNRLYRSRPFARGRKMLHYDPFFFPLDSIYGWNRLYGRRGFFQHQSVVPMRDAPATTRRLLAIAAEWKQGSFLVVLKSFGERRSPGTLSFPMPGVTLALDFPNRGDSTKRLLREMEEVVLSAGGRLYAAKDATMSGATFRAGYPNWRAVEARRDRAMMSDFWRRVTADAT